MRKISLSKHQCGIGDIGRNNSSTLRIQRSTEKNDTEEMSSDNGQSLLISLAFLRRAAKGRVLKPEL